MYIRLVDGLEFMELGLVITKTNQSDDTFYHKHSSLIGIISIMFLKWLQLYEDEG